MVSSLGEPTIVFDGEFVPQNHSNDVNTQQPRTTTNQGCMKVFVQRDYSEGTLVKFNTWFPPELEDKVLFLPEY